MRKRQDPDFIMDTTRKYFKRLFVPVGAHIKSNTSVYCFSNKPEQRPRRYRSSNSILGSSRSKVMLNGNRSRSTGHHPVMFCEITSSSYYSDTSGTELHERYENPGKGYRNCNDSTIAINFVNSDEENETPTPEKSHRGNRRGKKKKVIRLCLCPSGHRYESCEGHRDRSYTIITKNNRKKRYQTGEPIENHKNIFKTVPQSIKEAFKRNLCGRNQAHLDNGEVVVFKNEDFQIKMRRSECDGGRHDNQNSQDLYEKQRRNLSPSSRWNCPKPTKRTDSRSELETDVSLYDRTFDRTLGPERKRHSSHLSSLKSKQKQCLSSDYPQIFKRRKREEYQQSPIPPHQMAGTHLGRQHCFKPESTIESTSHLYGPHKIRADTIHSHSPQIRNRKIPDKMREDPSQFQRGPETIPPYPPRYETDLEMKHPNASQDGMTSVCEHAYPPPQYEMMPEKNHTYPHQYHKVPDKEHSYPHNMDLDTKYPLQNEMQYKTAPDTIHAQQEAIVPDNIHPYPHQYHKVPDSIYSYPPKHDVVPNTKVCSAPPSQTVPDTKHAYPDYQHEYGIIPDTRYAYPPQYKKVRNKKRCYPSHYHTGPNANNAYPNETGTNPKVYSCPPHCKTVGTSTSPSIGPDCQGASKKKSRCCCCCCPNKKKECLPKDMNAYLKEVEETENDEPTEGVSKKTEKTTSVKQESKKESHSEKTKNKKEEQEEHEEKGKKGKKKSKEKKVKKKNKKGKKGKEDETEAVLSQYRMTIVDKDGIEKTTIFENVTPEITNGLDEALVFKNIREIAPKVFEDQIVIKRKRTPFRPVQDNLPKNYNLPLPDKKYPLDGTSHNKTIPQDIGTYPKTYRNDTNNGLFSPNFIKTTHSDTKFKKKQSLYKRPLLPTLIKRLENRFLGKASKSSNDKIPIERDASVKMKVPLKETSENQKVSEECNCKKRNSCKGNQHIEINSDSNRNQIENSGEKLSSEQSVEASVSNKKDDVPSIKTEDTMGNMGISVHNEAMITMSNAIALSSSCTLYQS